MNKCCDISYLSTAAACSPVNPNLLIKRIRIKETDFKERYKMPFSKFLKLVKDCPDLSIYMEPKSDGKIYYYECLITGGIYSVRFRMK